MNLRTALTIAAFFCIFLTANATLILPPNDLGDMLNSTSIVVYGKVVGHHEENVYQNIFEVSKVIKGSLAKGQEIIIDEYSTHNREIYTKISGDVDYQVGGEYLLFLFKTYNGHYKANMLAMGVWQNVEVNNEATLIHPKAFMDLCLMSDGSNIQSLKGTYKTTQFITHLSEIVNNFINWNYFSAGYIDLQNDDFAENEVENSRLADCPNNPPAHCTTLFGNPNSLNNQCNADSPGKYPSACGASPTFTVSVSQQASNDASSTTEITDLQNAVATMNGMPGINITYSGLTSCPIDTPCPASTAIQGCSNFADANIVIFFDDPCNEIDPLSGCSGTLALGGTFASSTCHEDCCNNMWATNGLPFLVINEGIGCIGQYKYSATLIHEMLHATGLNHINGDCTALMNGLICNENANAPQAPNFGITALDNACTDWMYNIEVIPVTLSDFTASRQNAFVQLRWTTSLEINNDYFDLERSPNGIVWNSIAKVNGKGDSYDLEEYSFLDRQPLNGRAYYRLVQTDYDGTFTTSEKISVVMNDDHPITIYPNPVFTDKIFVNFNNAFPNNSEVGVTIFNLNGQKIRTQNIKVLGGIRNQPINMKGLKPSVYFVEISSAMKTVTRRIVKN